MTHDKVTDRASQEIILFQGKEYRVKEMSLFYSIRLTFYNYYLHIQFLYALHLKKMENKRLCQN